MSSYFLNFEKIGYVRGPRYDGCILCGILEGEPSLVDLTVHKSEHFVVSVNLYPYNPGHLLIYPKRHVCDIRELSAEESAELSEVQRLCLDVTDKIQHPKAYNIGYNMGTTAGGSIEHLHLHIIPRYEREVGIADLIAGRRVMVQSPFETQKIVSQAIEQELKG